jgi:hypothetical protein
VTLSACDTGVGEVRNGEGVYGLRRAFFLSGAETLVMSLWPVSDVVTRQMMSAYYSRLEGRPRPWGRAARRAACDARPHEPSASVLLGQLHSSRRVGQSWTACDSRASDLKGFLPSCLIPVQDPRSRRGS